MGKKSKKAEEEQTKSFIYIGNVVHNDGIIHQFIRVGEPINNSRAAQELDMLCKYVYENMLLEGYIQRYDDLTKNDQIMIFNISGDELLLVHIFSIKYKPMLFIENCDYRSLLKASCRKSWENADPTYVMRFIFKGNRLEKSTSSIVPVLRELEGMRQHIFATEFKSRPIWYIVMD
jgi:hypothetical protein